MQSISARSTYIFLLLISFIHSVNADSYIPTEAMSQQEASPYIDITNAKQPFPGVLTGGQPTQQQLKSAEKQGYKTVVNLRVPGEMQEWDERTVVKDLKMNYVLIPVSGGKGITKNNSELLMSILDKPENFPVLIHCSSGNRVGALFALGAFYNGKLTQDGALAIGSSAGLTRLKSSLSRKFSKVN